MQANQVFKRYLFMTQQPPAVPTRQGSPQEHSHGNIKIDVATNGQHNRQSPQVRVKTYHMHPSIVNFVWLYNSQPKTTSNQSSEQIQPWFPPGVPLKAQFITRGLGWHAATQPLTIIAMVKTSGDLAACLKRKDSTIFTLVKWTPRILVEFFQV